MPVATAPHSPLLRHRRRHETQPRRLRTLHVRAGSRSPHRDSARARTLPRLRAMTTTLTPYRTARSSRPSLSLAQARVGLDRRALTGAGGNTRRNMDLGGTPFTMYKFRTMRPTRQNGKQVWAQAEDERVTPIGRLLRTFRLDELPQLFNVLIGDMNIVGPRPEQPDIFVYLREQIESYPRRQRVRPGITGWAQVNQGYDTSVDDVRHKVRYDLEYIRRQSALEDLKIMLRTVPVMLLRRGSR